MTPVHIAIPEVIHKSGKRGQPRHTEDLQEKTRRKSGNAGRLGRLVRRCLRLGEGKEVEKENQTAQMCIRNTQASEVCVLKLCCPPPQLTMHCWQTAETRRVCLSFFFSFLDIPYCSCQHSSNPQGTCWRCPKRSFGVVWQTWFGFIIL